MYICTLGQKYASIIKCNFQRVKNVHDASSYRNYIPFKLLSGALKADTPDRTRQKNSRLFLTRRKYARSFSTHSK